MPVEMPYRIESFPGRGQMIPFKIYPSGFQAQATPEEHQAWQYLQEIETQRAVNAMLVSEREIALAAAEAALAEAKAITEAKMGATAKPKQR